MASVSLLFPTQIFALFDSSPEVLAMAPDYMFINIFLFLGFFLMSPTLALINGVGFTMLNFLIGLLDGVVVRIPLCLFLCDQIGLYGIFWGNTLASYVTVILAAPISSAAGGKSESLWPLPRRQSRCRIPDLTQTSLTVPAVRLVFSPQIRSLRGAEIFF